MSKIYRLTLAFLCLFLGLQLQAQRVVNIPDNGDPFIPVDIFPVIMGDTAQDGSRMDNNTIYTLDNGAVYITTGRIVNKPEWSLSIQATDLTNTASKPIITRIPNASGSYPDIMRPEGDVTLKNLWIISGEKGPGEQHDWGKIRFQGENTRVIVDHCIIEKDRGGFLQMRANGIKCYVSNSVFRNGGNRKILQGNGRGIDARNFTMDTLMVTNTIIHNIQDRVFRSQGGVTPHNYIEFDHCTVFNQAGRHGAFQFGRANTVKVTNNLLVNPIMLGTSPFYTDEQTQPDNEAHKVFTIDTLYETTNLTFASNNVFWTQDVLDYYATNDSVSQVAVYSDLIAQELGEGAGDTYFSEEVSLGSIPPTILQYVKDLYANPNADDMFDFIVEDIAVAGSALDFGNLFDFSTFDPCYDPASMSASAGTKGGAVGAINFCGNLSAGLGSTVVEIVVNSDDHNTLEQAVIAADLAGALSGEGPFTVFAPTDSAFSLIDTATLNALLADPTGDLADILKYHVVSGEILSTDLADGISVPTLQGQEITVTLNEDGAFINGAKVTMADLRAGNGVVHVIDAVLLPPAPVDSARYVYIDPGNDPFNPVDIFPVIMGDTIAGGARVSNNTIYQLENGRVYITTGRIVNKPEWKLHIEAVDLDDIGNKPIITRIPNASGSYPDIMRPEGDVTLKNLWIISGEKGPGEQHDWGKIRIQGENTRVIVDHCIIEKDRGGFIQMRANGVKCYVTNSVLRNGGNRKILQGNGRGIDARNFSLDTLVMRNTIVHNIQDRVFRSQGGVTPHNYLEFDKVTVFNQAGRHGAFQFGRALTVKVTNNLLVNPIMLGTSPFYTDEQTQPDNEAHKVFTIDTLYDGTDLTFASNNIFWTQDVLDYYATNDSVSQVAIYSDLIQQSLGDDAANGYFEEALTLGSIPPTILEYVQDLYANPNADDMFDFIVEDIAVAGTALDFGNLFDFSTFNPCYDENSTSATAATDGGPIGATETFCNLLTNIWNPNILRDLDLAVNPNPVKNVGTFVYRLKNAARVNLSIYDMMGRQLTTLVNERQQEGDYQISWARDAGLKAGVYLARLQTETGEMSIKIVIQ